VNVRREFSRSHYSIYPVRVKQLLYCPFRKQNMSYKLSQCLTFLCGFAHIHVRKSKRKHGEYVILSRIEEPFGLTSI